MPICPLLPVAWQRVDVLESGTPNRFTEAVAAALRRGTCTCPSVAPLLLTAAARKHAWELANSSAAIEVAKNTLWVREPPAVSGRHASCDFSVARCPAARIVQLNLQAVPSRRPPPAVCCLRRCTQSVRAVLVNAVEESIPVSLPSLAAQMSSAVKEVDKGAYSCIYDPRLESCRSLKLHARSSVVNGYYNEESKVWLSKPCDCIQACVTCG